MSAAVPVVVTGVGGGGFGEQLLKALRLADRRYEIIATDTTALSKGFARSDVRYVVPRAGDADYVPALLAACRRHAAVAVLPGSEPELRALSAARDQFAAQGIFLPINPAGVIDICLDKDRTSAFLEAHGFRVPHTVRIDTVDDLARVDRFPSVLKPSVGGGGSADVTIAQDEHELLAFGRYLLASGRQLIAQEYVGTGEQEFTVGVLCTMDGELLNSIAVRRLTMSGLSNRVKVPNRTGRTALGDTLVISSGVSQGEIGAFPDVTRPCETIATALGARGPLNVQCRMVDGDAWIFEINPRFSGTTSLRALVGYNEPDALISEHVLGRPVERRFRYGHGTILRGLDETLVDWTSVPRALDAT